MFPSESAELAEVSQTALGQILAGLPFRVSLLFVIVYLVILWLLLLKFVVDDSRRRSADRLFVRFSFFLVLCFNFPGLLLYLLWRPPLTFGEAERLRLEEEMLRLEIKKLRKERRLGRNGAAVKEPEPLSTNDEAQT